MKHLLLALSLGVAATITASQNLNSSTLDTIRRHQLNNHLLSPSLYFSKNKQIKKDQQPTRTKRTAPYTRR